MTATYVFRPVDILYKKERFNSSRITYDPEDITLKTDVRRCVNIHTAQLVLITWKRSRKLANISNRCCTIFLISHSTTRWMSKPCNVRWNPKTHAGPCVPRLNTERANVQPCQSDTGTYIGLYDTWKGCKLLPHRRTLLKNGQVNVSIGP